VLYVLVTTHVRLAVERSRRSRASATRRQSINLVCLAFFWTSKAVCQPSHNLGKNAGQFSVSLSNVQLSYRTSSRAMLKPMTRLSPRSS